MSKSEYKTVELKLTTLADLEKVKKEIFA